MLCLSLLTFKEHLYVLSFAICRCICMQSTEVSVSARIVYIYDDLGFISFYCTLDVDDTG